MKWLRDPLAQFFIIGALLLLVYGAASGFLGRGARRIEIGEAEVEMLAGNFERQWRRPPTEDELRGLVRGRVREEVAYREALALGLDTDDTIVRRRMVQKMELLAQDLALMADPTDEELRQFFAERPEDYRLPDRVSFQQVFFSVDRRGAAAEQDAAELLTRLRSGGVDAARIEELGDSLMVPVEFYRASPGEVERVFGEGFAETVFGLDEGWHGPLPSPFGVHLLQVTERSDGGAPAYEDVRADLVRDFNLQRTETAKERLYEGLLSGYEVTIDEAALTRATLEAARPGSR